MSWQFGRSLLPCREPLVSRLARRVEPCATPARLSCTRHATWLRDYLGTAQLAISSMLLASAPVAVRSMFVNVLGMPLVLLVFVVKCGVRRRRFCEVRMASWADTMRTFTRPSAASLAETVALPGALRASVAVHAAAAVFAAAQPSAWTWALGGLAANHCVLAMGMRPRSAMLGPNLARLPPTRRAEVALTFDDGPDPEVTPRVLDMLDEHAARASFFCIGARARAHPTLVREVARRGHSVENHTQNHLYRFAAMTAGGIRREVADAQVTLAEIAGTPPVFFRAPMGLRNPLLQPVLAASRVSLVSWTRRALDGVRGDAAGATRRLCRGLAAGDVLLLHDGCAARTMSGEAVALSVLPDLLRAMRDAGLRSVTLRAGTSDAA